MLTYRIREKEPLNKSIPERGKGLFTSRDDTEVIRKRRAERIIYLATISAWIVIGIITIITLLFPFDILMKYSTD